MGKQIKINAKKSLSTKENLGHHKQKTDFRSQSSHVDRILHLQRTISNQDVQKLIRSGALQTKLMVGQPEDKYEQEADRVAEAVIRMIEFDPLHQPIKFLQVRKPPIQSLEVAPDFETRINHLSGRGQPLPESVRAFFEPRFGYDFSRVRIHTDVQSSELARVLNARAFTVGQDVVFGAGQYAPWTILGRRLLAHELVHVIQQTDRRIALGERPGYLQCATSRLTSPLFADDTVLQAVFRGEQALQRGYKGPAVKKIQQALIEAGFPLPVYGADSDFGGETEAAVLNYQRAHGLEANGIIGTTTLGSLDALFSTPPTTTPEISARDVIDERIDVVAQKAILRMRSRSPDRAYELLSFIKKDQLRGFVGDDLRLAAEHAAELGTVRWKLVPKYQDAKVVPGAGSSLPLAVYKEGARESRERMDAITDVVCSQAAKMIKGGGTTSSTKKKYALIYDENDIDCKKWAVQFKNKDSLSRAIIPITAPCTKDQVVEKVKEAASKLVFNGEVIFLVGHGGSGGSTADFVDIAPAKEWRLIKDYGKEVFYDRKPNKHAMTQEKHDNDAIIRAQSPNASNVEKKLAIGARKRKELRRKYMVIGNFLQSGHVVIFLTCNVGNAKDLIDKIADDWGVCVIAPKTKIDIWQDNNGKIRVYIHGDAPGQGSNTARARTELPIFDQNNSYRSGCP